MFERFTGGTRRVVELAQIEARSLGHGYIGTEHLVLALVAEDLGVATRVLHRAGIDAPGFKALLQKTVGTSEDEWARDADALRTIGIDLNEVRRRVEQAFGPDALSERPKWCTRKARWGHMPLTPKSKRVLERSLREALQRGHRYIGSEHVLLAILRDRSALGTRLVEELGSSPDELRNRLVAEIRRAS